MEWMDLIFHRKLCMDCHEEWILENHLCRDCLRKIEKVYGRNRILSQVDCCFPYHYSGEIKKLLTRYKFQNHSYLYRLFVDLLEEYIKDHVHRWELIVSVPYAKNRIRERGYEPVTIIAERLSENIKIDYQAACKKIKETPDQHFLNAEERTENLKGAFRCDPTVKNKRILLIDDIMTSGSTLRECSREILKAGALSVDCLVIASEKREEKGFWTKS